MTNVQKAVQHWQQLGNVSASIVAQSFGVDISEFWAEYNASRRSN